MSTLKTIAKRRTRRKHRVRNGLNLGSLRPRVSVTRTLKQIYAQIIDDASHTTLASFSSLVLKDAKGDKKAVARQVGIELGKIAQEKSLSEVVFDRGSRTYTGRIAALADGLRESGLKF